MVINYFNLLKVVHGDIKPDNILIDYDKDSKILKDIKVIDFGTTYIHSNKPRIIATNVATPEYCPHEQLVLNRNMLMNSKEWSHDIFSLGVVFLELILGWPVWMSMKSRVQCLYDSNLEIITTGIFSVPLRDKAKIKERQIKSIENLDYLLDNAMGIKAS